MSTSKLMGAFAHRVKAHRKHRRLTQSDLGKRSGLGREVIANLESGRLKGISLDNAIKLAAALQIPLSALAPEVADPSDRALLDANRKLNTIRELLDDEEDITR